MDAIEHSQRPFGETAGSVSFQALTAAIRPDPAGTARISAAGPVPGAIPYTAAGPGYSHTHRGLRRHRELRGAW